MEDVAGCHDLFYSMLDAFSYYLRKNPMMAVEDEDGGVLNYYFVVMIREGWHRQWDHCR